MNDPVIIYPSFQQELSENNQIDFRFKRNLKNFLTNRNRHDKIAELLRKQLNLQQFFSLKRLRKSLKKTEKSS